MLSDRRRNHASRIQKQMKLESLENRMLLAADLAWSAPEVFTAGDSPWGVDAGDLNGDGNIDLAVANFGNGPADVGDISILMGRGDGTFEEEARLSGRPHS